MNNKCDYFGNSLSFPFLLRPEAIGPVFVSTPWFTTNNSGHNVQGRMLWAVYRNIIITHREAIFEFNTTCITFSYKSGIYWL